MTGLQVIPIGVSVHGPRAAVPALIDSLGEPGFSSELAGYLHEVCGSVLLGGYHLRADAPTIVAAAGLGRLASVVDHARRYIAEEHWRHDPVLAAARANCNPARPVLVRANPWQIDDPVLQSEFYRPAGIVDKLALFAQRGNDIYCVSLMHAAGSGRFDDDSVRRVAAVADTVFSAMTKHSALCDGGQRPPGNALSCVLTIEQRFMEAGLGLTPRERQVCARILKGVGGPGIAIDLGIGTESVATYRKRAYRRLGIATQHELMRIYLGL